MALLVKRPRLTTVNRNFIVPALPSIAFGGGFGGLFWCPGGGALLWLWSVPMPLSSGGARGQGWAGDVFYNTLPAHSCPLATPVVVVMEPSMAYLKPWLSGYLMGPLDTARQATGRR